MDGRPPGGKVLPELSAGCFSLDVSIPAPIRFMIFSICSKKAETLKNQRFFFNRVA